MDDAKSMNKDKDFWWITLIRGLIALLAGSLIVVIPAMANLFILLPIAIVVAILGLAIYGILDSVLVLITSFLVSTRPTRAALRIQGASGVALGICLVWLFSDYVQLSWFLILIVIQSLMTAIVEFLVARHSMSHSTSRWNFSAAGFAFLFSLLYAYVLFFQAVAMTTREISWLIFGYLLALGTAQCFTAARMLYSDYSLQSVPSLSVSTQEI
ncbi:MAG: hypothetical protein HIU93_16455 [Acidobacteria bacterium]|nr:hypothetical protein [Acidobacteriota bacterium]